MAADFRLGPRSLAGMNGLVKEVGQDRAQGAGRLGLGFGAGNLTQNLGFAQNHRIESRGDAHELFDGRLPFE